MTTIGGYFPGKTGSNGAVLVLWVDVIPNATYTLQVGAGGKGQATESTPATRGQDTTMSGPGGVFYSAGGGLLPTSTGQMNPVVTVPAPVWAVLSGSYLYGIGGVGGNPVAVDPAGGDGSSGLILIEWIE